jgi:hypothetical protein
MQGTAKEVALYRLGAYKCRRHGAFTAQRAPWAGAGFLGLHTCGDAEWLASYGRTVADLSRDLAFYRRRVWLQFARFDLSLRDHLCLTRKAVPLLQPLTRSAGEFGDCGLPAEGADIDGPHACAQARRVGRRLRVDLACHVDHDRVPRSHDRGDLEPSPRPRRGRTCLRPLVSILIRTAQPM